MAVTNARGTALPVSVKPASPHKVELVEKVLEERFIEPLPEKLISDEAYDLYSLDQSHKQKAPQLQARR